MIILGTPRVSVILPCYNGARWISQAIESVLAQTYKDFELLVIDDGSTDNSREIVSSYLHDRRVRYIYQENRGFSGAINRGIKESKGDFIGFIGQDDLWLPHKLELQTKYLSKHRDVDLVHSSYFAIDSEGRVIGIRNVEIPNVSSKRGLIEELFLRNFIGFETVLVKKRCLDEAGLFDERMVGFSDHDMWLRIAGKFNIQGYIGKPLVKKRIHELQLTKVRIEDNLKDEFLLVKKAVDQYPFLKRIEHKKLASLYYAWGIALLQKGNREDAKRKFLKSIRCQPWKVKSIIAYMTPALYKTILNHYIEVDPEIRRGLEWLED